MTYITEKRKGRETTDLNFLIIMKNDSLVLGEGDSSYKT